MRLRTPHATVPKSYPRPIRRGGDDRQRMQYSIAELSRFPFTTFVDQAFRALLKRPPDSSGFDAHVRLLISGGSKIEVLGNLRYSPEGRALGVRVDGLLPRYMLTKAYRLPVIGYPIEWLVSLAGLPRVVQHQRAADTVQYSRSYEIDAAGRALKQEVAVMRDHIARLGEQARAREAQFETELGALRGELQTMTIRTHEAQQHVLGMNHWLASLRENLGALDAAEAEQHRLAEHLLADVSADINHADDARGRRLVRWSERLATQLAARARVLDFGSGSAWVAQLAERGLDASGVDTNAVRCARAVAAGVSMLPGSLRAALARTADDSLDAISALSIGSLLRRVDAGSFLADARRALKPSGVLLFAFDEDPAVRADRLAGAADPALDADLLQRVLLAAGFVDVEIDDAADVASVMARNP